MFSLTNAGDATLVVIDMQPQGFLYAGWMVKPVLALMKAAMEQRHGLILVRYVDVCAGEIAPEIIAAAKGYERLVPVDKTAEDGSQEIIDACGPNGLTLDRLILCGVTAEECVNQTAHGLARKLSASRIEVVKDGCDGWQGKRFDWVAFPQLSNVIPV